MPVEAELGLGHGAVGDEAAGRFVTAVVAVHMDDAPWAGPFPARGRCLVGWGERGLERLSPPAGRAHFWRADSGDPRATGEGQSQPQPMGCPGQGTSLSAGGGCSGLTSEPQELASVQDHGWGGEGPSMEGRGEELSRGGELGGQRRPGCGVAEHTCPKP